VLVGRSSELDLADRTINLSAALNKAWTWCLVTACHSIHWSPVPEASWSSIRTDHTFVPSTYQW